MESSLAVVADKGRGRHVRAVAYGQRATAAIGIGGKPQSDSERYRQMGNAICVNVAEWLGKRIVEAP